MLRVLLRMLNIYDSKDNIIRIYLHELKANQNLLIRVLTVLTVFFLSNFHELYCLLYLFGSENKNRRILISLDVNNIPS